MKADEDGAGERRIWKGGTEGRRETEEGMERQREGRGGTVVVAVHEWVGGWRGGQLRSKERERERKQFNGPWTEENVKEEEERKRRRKPTYEKRAQRRSPAASSNRRNVGAGGEWGWVQGVTQRWKLPRAEGKP